ncbi:MAG: TetR/AcrR family transcriptional regulator [Chitinophagales bacterium]|nr:TetR/AcrR family transcriptional regulator [Chitinophagales bacterium]
MGIAERKEREKQEMRELILDAATQMFLEDGYDKTSVRNIAEKIEYSPATIYLYFKDKDELFFAIHEIGFQKLLSQMETTRAIINPLERLRQIGVIYLEFALKNPEYYDLMFIMRAPINSIKEKHALEHQKEPACWYYGETSFAFVQQTISECMEQQLIKAENPMLTSMYVWSFVHGMASLHIRDRFLVMDLDSEQIRNMILLALDEMLSMLKK